MTHPYEMLKELGLQLDNDIFPRIKIGGIVMPGDAAEPKFTWAKETINERQRTRRPESRPWTGTAGRQRKTDRRGASSPTSSTISTNLKAQYENELTAVREAYPGMQVWNQDDGLWLLTESSLLPCLQQKAVFFTGIPFTEMRSARGWGFWMRIPKRYPSWIGPRHTNLPDGSICAFEPTDGTWEIGDSLIVLLDLYTVWALRHLHLQVFNRWPGRQVAHYVHERLTEIKPTELCGCGSDKLYCNCCQKADQKAQRILEAIKFQEHGGYQRTPPDEVNTFIQNRTHAPQINELLPVVC